MNDEDTTYLVERLHRVVELLKSGEVHMAIAKLNADISALSNPPPAAFDEYEDNPALEALDALVDAAKDETGWLWPDVAEHEAGKIRRVIMEMDGGGK